MFKKLLTLLVIALLPLSIMGQTTDNGKPVKVITDASIGAFNYWSQDTVYNMSGLVFVEDGEVLMIEPGTIIKSNPGTGTNSTALVVARGGRIYAEGTQAEPIVFTSISDDVDNPVDIPLDTVNGVGLWGGVILLGNARINTTTGVGQIEGIDPGEPRGQYGGSDDNDNSGILKYVSIRHGGTEIGAANEINGLTLGAVGRGTTISHVEVFYNYDDGFEFFGGTVNCDHLVAAYCGDDAFDYDEGFRGTGQFWFSVQGETKGDRGGEHDGGTSPVDGMPFALPLISNVTYVGAGSFGTQRCFEIRDNAGTAYMNSIFYQHGSYGLKVEASGGEPTDSQARLAEGNVFFKNNIWYDFGNGNTAAAITNNDAAVEAALFTSGNDIIEDPGIPHISRTPDGNFDPRPAGLGSTSWGSWIDPNGAGGYTPVIPAAPYASAVDVSYPDFEAVSYPGAFDPTASMWVCTWTALDQYGYLVDDCSLAGCPSDNGKPLVSTVSADVDGFTVWSRENIYHLSGLVFVEDGDTLLIEPGTIVKSDPGTGTNSTALVVARGGQIYAIGSHTEPIIFTSISDDVDNPVDIPLDTVNGVGLWGGVILLGNARINTTTGVGQIEGIDPGEPRGQYGGSDDDDNTGVVKYVSIRHGGTEIGAANEINGLTLGAVGRGTTISHVEVFYNYDDGFEFFGGTVNCDHLIAAYCGDDAFDYDEGFRGTGQFWFSVQGETKGDRGGEHDGGTSPVDGMPFALPLISNVTYTGSGPFGTQRCFEIRDNAGTAYMNSIFYQHGSYGLKVEASGGEPTDSQARLAEGNVFFKNNIWYDFGNGNTPAAITNNDAAVEAALFTSGNDLAEDPGISSIARTPNGTLDPRPQGLGSTSWMGWIDPNGAGGYSPVTPAAPYASAVDVSYPDFEAVDYPGAFDPNVSMFDSWLAGWSVLDCGGFIGDVPLNGGGCCVGDRGNMDNDSEDIVDISDLVFMVDYQFRNGDAPACYEEADIAPYNPGNGEFPDDIIDIADLVYMVDYQFRNGDAPPPCSL